MRRIHRYRFSAAVSISPHTAWITMAASTARGRGASNSASSTSTSSTMMADISPVTWVCPPERREAAVFDSEPATPSPAESPAAMFAAPDPTSSWFESIEYPSLAANSRAALSPSASPTIAMASPPNTTGAMSPSSMPGSPIGGRPLGTSPTTATPRSARSAAEEITMAAISTTSPHGTRARIWLPGRAPPVRLLRAGSSAYPVE